MKKTYSIWLWLAVLTMNTSLAQNFSGKTNDIRLNFTDPSYAGIATSLPVITWKTPQLEYTNSQNSEIDIDAVVKSDVPLKSVKIILSDGTTSRG